MDDNEEKARIYDNENLSRYAKLVTDGLLEAAGDDRAVQGKSMDSVITVENLTVLTFSEDVPGKSTKELAKIKLTGRISVETDED